jgi:hypothetical protein
MGKDDRITHDPDKLAKLVSGVDPASATKKQAADTITEIVKQAQDGTLPSGGTY